MFFHNSEAAARAVDRELIYIGRARAPGRAGARALAGARAGPSCVCILRMENIVAIFVPSPVQSELFEVSDTKGQAYMFMYEQ